MLNSNQIRQAVEEKSPSGFSTYTPKQITERIIDEDSFLGKKITAAMQMGVTREQALNYYSYGKTMGMLPQPKKSNFFERIGESAKQRSANVGMAIERQAAGEQGLGSTLLQTAGEATGLAFGDAPGEVLSSATNLVPEGVKEPIKETGIAILQTDIGQAGLQALSQGMDAYNSWKEANPVVAENLESVVNISAAVPVGKIVGATGKAGVSAIKSTTKKAIPSPKKIDDIIREGIEKGIRPSVAGKNTAKDMGVFTKDSSEAVKSIIERKNLLELTDDAGETVILPENLKQFAEAIDQTKEQVFKEYDALAKQAGDVGAEIDLAKVADELVDAVSDPKFVSLEDQSPEIADYLLKRASALEKRGTYTAEQAQQAIKNYNKTLESFYRNPSYENYAKASIDAMIANNLRESVDNTISNAVGEGYQMLKNKYGALRAIEKDVVKRAMVDARKNTKGLLDFTDIFTGGELVSGLITANPASIARAGIQKGIKEWFKVLNDPNRAIKSMFKKVDAFINTQ